MSFSSRRHRRSRTPLAIVTALGTAATFTPAAFAQAGEQVTFSVTNFTDLHGHLETQIGGEEPAAAGTEMGAAHLAALIKKVNEGQEYNLTTSGDNVGGSAFVSALSEDQYTLDALNAMGVDASAVGNHEFDKGFADITDRIQPASDYPILGANVFHTDGTPALPASHVEDIDGVKVGYVGAVTSQTVQKVSPSALEGIQITDPVEATNAEASRLKESGEADVVIALFHEDAADFAQQFNADVDILFGGDSHAKSAGTVERQDALPLHWAQGWEYGKLLNDADITYDLGADRLVDVKITQYDATAAESLTPDPAVEAIVSQAQAEAAELGQQVVATLEHPLTRGSDEGAKSGSNRGVESTANNYIAESARWAMSAQIGQEIDLGMMNAGGVRADIPAGDVTYEQVLTAQPFGNNIGYTTLTGADIIEALEAQWQPGAERTRLALGLSPNVSYAFDPSAEQGSRIISATINGEPIDPDREYTVAASTFLLEGGDGFTSLANGTMTDVGLLDVTALVDYMASEDSALPTAQTAVGVQAPKEVTAGEKVTVSLSSLNYTSEGEPMATTAAVALGSATGEAAIDNAAQEGDEQLNHRGRATVELTVPEALEGEQEFVITTDQGTKVTVPVTVLPASGATPDAPSSSSGSDSESDSGSSAGAAVGIAAAIAAVIALVISFSGNLPAPLRDALEQLKAVANL